MEKTNLLYEGKAKKVYETNDPALLIVDYKDDATAFNGLKKGTIAGKGEINNRVTNHLMKLWRKTAFPRTLWRSFPRARRRSSAFPSCLWRSSCATSPPVPWPSAWALPKARR